MNEFLSSLLQAVIIAAVPVLTYAVKLIRQVAANAAAKTDSIKMQGYLNEAAQAISEAVEATSQTYVDSLKQADKFTPEAQREAAEKALAACIANISPAAQFFIESVYGDITEYLTTRIEAEVRRQKKENPLMFGVPLKAIEGVKEIPGTAAG